MESKADGGKVFSSVSVDWDQFAGWEGSLRDACCASFFTAKKEPAFAEATADEGKKKEEAFGY